MNFHLWPHIVAGVTALPLSLPRPCPEEHRGGQHWPAVGAAILAGVGIGAFDTMTSAQARDAGPAR
jgi:hypothetical protein